MNYPSVSVIIPNWNGEKYIGSAIESCLKQSFKPLEIIVCDDGSIDNSKKIVKSFKKEKIPVILLELDHSGGPAYPRNQGIKIARGDWIAFLDNDDEWEISKLENQLKMLSKKNIYACSTNAYRKVNNRLLSKTVCDFKGNYLNLMFLLYSNQIVCSSMLVKKTLIDKVGLFDTEIKVRSFADYIMWLKVAFFTDVLYINKPLVVYRDEPNDSIRSDINTPEVIDKISRSIFLTWLLHLNIFGYIKVQFYIVFVGFIKKYYRFIFNLKKYFIGVKKHLI